MYKYNLKLIDKGLNRIIEFPIRYDSTSQQYKIKHIIAGNKEWEISSFLKDQGISYINELCDKYLDEIFKQPEGKIQLFLDNLSSVLKNLNEDLKRYKIDF